jgi:hypothetical protein
MDLAAPQLHQLLHGLLCPRIGRGADGKGDENLIGVEPGIPVAEMVYLQVGNGVNDAGGNQMQVIFQACQMLQRVQKECIERDAAMLIVESDVVVAPHTLQGLYDGAKSHENCAIAASVTVNDAGEINYPYEYAKGKENQVVEEKKHLSFCCSLLTPEFLRRFDFHELNPEKNWFDVTISHKALEIGMKNYLFTNLPVIHRPHQSRPWKQLKYTNPLKYYWIKWTKGFDKI